MCLAAAYWARVSMVYYATTSADAAAAGFDDRFLYQELRLPKPQRSLPCVALPVEGARAVLEEWAALPGRTEY